MADCDACGTRIQPGEEATVPRGGKSAAVTRLCPSCADQLEREWRAETESPDVAGAVLLSLAAALVASLLWYGFVVLTKFQLGLVAVAVGWLVAQAAIVGAGRKRGPIVQAISVAITLVAMGFSEYLIVRHFVAEALASQGITDLPWLFPADVILEVIVEGLKDDPLTLVFWAIALWEAYRLPAGRRLTLTRS